VDVSNPVTVASTIVETIVVSVKVPEPTKTSSVEVSVSTSGIVTVTVDTTAMVCGTVNMKAPSLLPSGPHVTIGKLVEKAYEMHVCGPPLFEQEYPLGQHPTAVSFSNKPN